MGGKLLSSLTFAHSRPTLVEAAELSDRNQLHLLATRAKRDIADGFLRLAALPTFALVPSHVEHLDCRDIDNLVSPNG
jgi:hypothetical protein